MGEAPEGPTARFSSTAIYMGRCAGYQWHSPRSFDGCIGRTAIYGRALSAEEVQAHYVQSTSREVTLRIDPRALNAGSNGKWINCRITLPQDCQSSIVPETILLNNAVPIDRSSVQAGREDGRNVLFVKFDRSSVQGILGSGLQTITVAGRLENESGFIGKGEIQVLK
jgi:tRNA threonylcarbamoyladenosine modification (KEOPS) complex  Pcc1 subunit